MSYKFDVFLSFKNLDSAGNSTRDSQLAHELYEFLTAKGLSVFQSNIVLEKLGETAFKKTIDDALDSAQILVAIGTSADNLESKWVRYEWDSFFTEILDGIKPAGKVFTYIEGMKIPALPRSLRQTQTISHNDASKQQLYNFIANALKANQSKPFFTWGETFSLNTEKSPRHDNSKPWVSDSVINNLLRGGGVVNTSMDFDKRIEEIKQDPGLNSEDKNFMIYMNEVAALDQQREKQMDKLIKLDEQSGFDNIREREAVFNELERLNQKREEKMAKANKILQSNSRNLENIFKKP